MNTQTNTIVTNTLTGEQFTAAVPSLGWEDAAKEQGAAMWGIDWDSMTCKRPNTKQDTEMNDAATLKHVEIIARRWFQRSYGNTYHRVYVHVTTEENVSMVLRNDFNYGYGDSYMETAQEMLSKEFGIELDGRDLTAHAAEKLGFTLSVFCADVQRKKDL